MGSASLDREMVGAVCFVPELAHQHHDDHQIEFTEVLVGAAVATIEK
jgi:hypothetical protein